MPEHWEASPGSLWAIHSPWQSRHGCGQGGSPGSGEKPARPHSDVPAHGLSAGPEVVSNAALGLSGGEAVAETSLWAAKVGVSEAHESAALEEV